MHRDHKDVEQSIHIYSVLKQNMLLRQHSDVRGRMRLAKTLRGSKLALYIQRTLSTLAFSANLPYYLWVQWLHLQYGSSILAHPKMVSYSAAALSQVELRSMPLCCNALKESGCSLKVSSVFLSAPTNASVVQGEKVHPVPVPAHPQQLQYDIIIIKSPQLPVAQVLQVGSDLVTGMHGA